MKVGDTVILVERYGRDRHKEVEITNETRVSFVVKISDWQVRKFNKQTGEELATSWGDAKIVSKEQYEQSQWINQNRRHIVSAVEKCNNVDKLKKIQEILES